MQSRTLLAVLIAVVCLVLIGAGVAGVIAFRELASMSRNLEDTTAKMDVVATNIERVSKQMQTLQSVNRQLSAMNGKLSKTNDLLVRTNASLGIMVGESKAADAKLARMEGDISIMSHKIAGSFLFRGVK